MLLLSVALSVAGVGGARAASVLYIRGGGNGHGIGMSQYGATATPCTAWAIRRSSRTTTRGLRWVRATRTGSFASCWPPARRRSPVRPPRPEARPQRSLFATSADTVGLAAGGRLQIAGVGGVPVGTPVSAPLTVTGLGPLQVSGLGAYRGSLQFRPDAHGGVETVDAVGLDDYVRGVVADEMPSSWTSQALDAQAVAARTYAITTTIGATGYDLYSDTRSQIYGGVRAETTATDAAVAATRGQAVTYGGRPVVTYFFTSSGGYTENIENVWTGSTPEPWLKGMRDPYDGAGNDPCHRWTQQPDGRHDQARCAGTWQPARDRGGRSRRLPANPAGVGGGHSGRERGDGAALQSIFGLATTNAAFITVSTTGARGSLRASIFPASTVGSVSVQMLGPAGAS